MNITSVPTAGHVKALIDGSGVRELLGIFAQAERILATGDRAARLRVSALLHGLHRLVSNGELGGRSVAGFLGPLSSDIYASLSASASASASPSSGISNSLR